MDATEARTRPPWLTAGWWLRGADGRLVLAQVPNPAISVWLATVVIGWTGLVDRTGLLTTVGRGALLAWAADELLRGASPFRRLLGAVVGVYVVVATFG